MAEQTYLVIFVLVLPALVVCIPFRGQLRHPITETSEDSFRYPFRDPFRHFSRHPFSDPFIDLYSFNNLLAQGEITSEPVNTSLYRLPQNLKPTKYDLTVVPYLVEGNFTFYGKVIISITAVQDASEIVLNALYLTINSLSLTDSAKALIECKHDLNETYQRLTITPSKPSLVTGKSYELTIEYTGLLKADLFGFYRSSYKIGSQVKWLAVTQFEPTYARKAFPCFDEPAFRAAFTVHVGRFEHQNSISNMRLKSTSEKLPQFEDRVIDTYEESPHMPTYLVAFCVSQMVSVSSSDGRFRVSMRENAVEQSKYVIGIGETILKTIADFVNVPYTLPKLDVIAIPDFSAGAMENWGMTTYREQYVLSERGVSNTKANDGILSVVAHEFGHQWFGNLVTPQWWSYTWLNEAFATYFQYDAPDMMEPQWGWMSLFLIDQLHLALSLDGFLKSTITSEVYTPREIESTFNYAPYAKGASVLRMTEHFLTRSVFQKGLNYYLTNSSASGIGTPEHLFSALDAAAKEKNVLPSEITVANVLTGWTTQGGFPLLNVSRAGNTLSLSQAFDRVRRDIWKALAKRGIDDGTIQMIKALYKRNTNCSLFPDNTPQTFWYIPLSYTTQSVADFQDTSAKDWLLPGFSKNITTSDNGWVIFNIQQTGYFRVNYDVNNWNLLAEQLLKDFNKIHVNNRAQLLDDAFSLLQMKQLEHNLFLNLTRYLSQEREYVVWYTAGRSLGRLLSQFMGTNAGNSLQEYVVSLLRPYYQYLSDINDTSATHQTSLGRIDFVDWACDLGISECETYTAKAFNAWYKYGATIDADIRSAVLCTGLKQGGDQEWEAVWNVLLQSSNPTDRPILIKALGCTQSETSIDRYLSALISSQSFNRQNKEYILQAVASRQTGLSPMIRFVVSNYDIIIKNMGESGVQRFVYIISQYMVLEEHMNQVRAIVNNKTAPAYLRSWFNESLTNAETRLKSAVDNQNVIQPWLDQHRTSDGAHLIPTHINTLLCLLTIFIANLRC